MYCLINAFLGSVKMLLKVSASNGSKWVTIGRRPNISGINPKLLISCAFTKRNKFFLCNSCSSLFTLNPMALVLIRRAIILSIPSNAPPQINNIFLVSTLIIFWSGCLRPPCGGTKTSVPSSIFNNPCCTPSPLTSLVIEALSPFLAILSISSIYTMPLCAASTS